MTTVTQMRSRAVQAHVEEIERIAADPAMSSDQRADAILASEDRLTDELRHLDLIEMRRAAEAAESRVLFDARGVL